MKRRFEGKVVLVTGAAGGIGLAAARAFADEGAQLAIADINADGAQAAAAALVQAGSQAVGFQVDLNDFAACERLVAQILERFGALHVAVNNAGINDAPYAEFEDVELDVWNRVISTNVTGLFHAMKAQVPAMRKTGGTAIVNTASAAGTIGVPNKAAYVTSKHAVVGLTRAAALDLIRHGIRVNAVCPGLTNTPMVAAAAEGNEELRRALIASAPIHRMAQPEEIASAILYLASDEAGFMVGSLMTVDGGLTTG